MASLPVFKQGFGAMGLSAFYSSAASTTEEQAAAVVRRAIERAGPSPLLINSACFYGALNVDGYGSNLRLLRKCLAGVDRSRVHIMVKVGMDTRAPVASTGTQWTLAMGAAAIAADIDYALEQLGVEFIDTVVLCRAPRDVPIEEPVAAMAAAVAAGKARAIGLSEANAHFIRRAHAVHPVWCIEQEFSLWSRDIEAEVLPTCRELGIKVVAYSPLGRGMLTGALRSRADEAFGGRDYRLVGQPRFAEGAFAANLALVNAAAAAVATRLGCSMGQLALAWLHAQGDDIIPIPGTSRVAHLDANMDAAAIALTKADVEELNSIFDPARVIGDRYPGMHMQFQTL